MDWGEDPSKWVVQKSHFGGGWYVAPPNDGEGWIVPEFPFRAPEQPSDPCPWRHHKDVDYWELQRRQHRPTA